MGRQFTGIIDVYKQTLESDGIIGLYHSMKIMYPQTMNNSYLNRFIVGFMISATSSIIVYPLDSIRRRMMMTSIGHYKYKGNVDCIKYIIRNEGIKSFYKGCGINV